MALVDTARELAGTRVTDEDGNEHVLEAAPPMSSDEIALLEESLPCPLPDDVRELLRFARGFENGPLESFDFAVGGGFGLEDIFPHAEAIAHDGFGNHWVVDLTPESTEWGPIFYACHDPAVIAYQSDTLAGFLEAFRELVQPPHKGPIDWVHEEAVMTIWDNHPGVVSRVDALNSGDLDLRAFAESLDDSWALIDLRNAKTGDGFAWGRYGPRTNVRRHGYHRIFAYQSKPWWKRLLGR